MHIHAEAQELSLYVDFSAWSLKTGYHVARAGFEFNKWLSKTLNSLIVGPPLKCCYYRHVPLGPSLVAAFLHLKEELGYRTFLNRDFACVQRNIECTKVACLEPCIQWQIWLEAWHSEPSLGFLSDYSSPLCCVWTASCSGQMQYYVPIVSIQKLFRRLRQKGTLIASLSNTLRLSFFKT